MEIFKRTKHTIIFQVTEFINTEGGMDMQTFGDPVSEMVEAVHNLELARKKDPRAEWIIACEVETVNEAAKK